MLRQIRKHNLSSKKKSHSRRRTQKGGALYSWDFDDKIGGLPAQRALWKTADSDCPPQGPESKTFGFDVYGVGVSQAGGSRRRRNNKSKSKKSKKPWGGKKNNKSRKNNNKRRY